MYSISVCAYIYLVASHHLSTYMINDNQLKVSWKNGYRKNKGFKIIMMWKIGKTNWWTPRENIPLEIFTLFYKEIKTFWTQCQLDSITLPIRSSIWSLSSKLLIGTSWHPKDEYWWNFFILNFVFCLNKYMKLILYFILSKS